MLGACYQLHRDVVCSPIGTLFMEWRKQTHGSWPYFQAYLAFSTTSVYITPNMEVQLEKWGGPNPESTYRLHVNLDSCRPLWNDYISM